MSRGKAGSPGEKGGRAVVEHAFYISVRFDLHFGREHAVAAALSLSDESIQHAFFAIALHDQDPVNVVAIVHKRSDAAKHPLFGALNF